MADPIFIAPHFDDVALSCGATVARLARSSSPLIVTIFGGDPEDEELSPYARDMHQAWRLHDGEVVDRRRAEDLCASRALGASVQRSWFNWLDAIYRDDRYESDEHLFGSVLQSDAGLELDIADAVAELGSGPVYVPLAIGNHVDHQIVHAAGLALAQRGRTVYGYADMPYALNRRAFKSRLSRLGALRSFTVTVSEDDFERKWSAIQCYVSQLRVIFRDLPNPRQQFVRFSHDQGSGGLAERFWRLGSDR